MLPTPSKPPIYWALALLPVSTAAPILHGPAPWAPAAALLAKISMGVPIDIDATRSKGGDPSSVYHYYGKPGHWARSCPEGLNVHYLSTNK